MLAFAIWSITVMLTLNISIFSGKKNMESTTGYTTTTTTTGELSPEATAVFGGVMIVFTIVIAIFVVAMIVSLWKIYKKAGQPGWASIVPFYNYYILMKIVGRPTWWLAPILLIPYVNIVFIAITYYDLGRSFGKSKEFNIFGLIIFPVYGFLKLGFGSDQYVGPAAGPGGDNVVPTVTPQPQPPAQPVAAAPVATPTPETPQPPVTTPETSAAPTTPPPSGPVPGQTFGTTTPPAEQPPVDPNAKQS